MKNKTEVFFVVCLAVFVVASISCSKKHHHPYAPLDHEHELPDHDHPHEHDPVTIIVEVPVLCDTTDIGVDFTGIIDRSGPNFYLLKVAGFPDEVVEEKETSSIPTEKTYRRSYEGFTGGAISMEKIRGSRAEAVKVEIVSQECSQ